ncbi:hypothetical protein [Microbacterium halophytorum]|uniref:hypothetical protein n=1 Tax=Microbacterium halophytorum TaxID=2067568 RepID=UPI000CFC50B6|nr:hypothetical protein [Microbacterium halophytorum]
MDPIEHRRNLDGETLGWMRPEGEGFVVVDLLGHERTGVVDWFEAERTLDELGLSYLAEPYELLHDDGTWLRVRIAEVHAGRVRVKEDDGGAVGAPQVYYELPVPVPADRLRRVR